MLAQPHARAVLVAEADGRFAIDGSQVSGEVAWVPAERADLLLILGSEGAIAVREGIAVTEVRGSGLRAAGGCAIALDGAPIVARYAAPSAQREHWRALAYTPRRSCSA